MTTHDQLPVNERLAIYLQFTIDNYDQIIPTHLHERWCLLFGQAIWGDYATEQQALDQQRKWFDENNIIVCRVPPKNMLASKSPSCVV